MNMKTKSILTWTPSVLAGLMIGGGAIVKLIAPPAMVQLYSKIGLLTYLPWLGIAELLFVALFLFKKTVNIGLLLLTGYFGGAMAVELSHGSIFIVPGIILTLVWAAAYVRKASFFTVAGQPNPAMI